MISALRITEHQGMAALSCGQRWIFFNEWGVLGGYQVFLPMMSRGYPLFFQNRRPMVFQKQIGNFALIDTDGNVLTTYDKHNDAPIAVFAAEKHNTIFWLEGKRLAVTRFSLQNETVLVTDLPSFELAPSKSSWNRVLLCGAAVPMGPFLRGRATDTPVEYDSEDLVLVPVETPFCKDLGTQTGSVPIENIKVTMGNFILYPRIKESGSTLDIRLRSNGSIETRATEIVRSVVHSSLGVGAN